VAVHDSLSLHVINICSSIRTNTLFVTKYRNKRGKKERRKDREKRRKEITINKKGNTKKELKKKKEKSISLLKCVKTTAEF
jgi:hypothetical protein